MWFIWWDPCGLACYIFGWITIHFVNYVLINEVVWPWWGGTLHGLAFVAGWECLIVLICAAFMRAAGTDPGSVEMHTATKADIYPPETDPDAIFKPKRRFCEKCECVKPPRAHHCSTCGRCINKMDHHCPWVNNCVGSNNMKFFLQFILYVFIGGVIATLVSVSRLVFCWRMPEECPEPTLHTLVMGIVATILGLFFAIFTSAMAFDQWEGLVTNTTGIESMKGWSEEDRSVCAGMRDACGEPFSYRWLLPLLLLPTSSSFYQWKATDSMDAYDIRDPLIKKHFRKVEQYKAHLAEQAAEDDRGKHTNAHVNTQKQKGRVSGNPTIGVPAGGSGSGAQFSGMYAGLVGASGEDTPDIASSISCARTQLHHAHREDTTDIPLSAASGGGGSAGVPMVLQTRKIGGKGNSGSSGSAAGFARLTGARDKLA